MRRAGAGLATSVGTCTTMYVWGVIGGRGRGRGRGRESCMYCKRREGVCGMWYVVCGMRYVLHVHIVWASQAEPNVM
ncbi:hypothetical protein GGR52DRAFT_560510, partial [Hypoxylon sp. FL1284]